MEKHEIPPEIAEIITTSHFAYLCTTDSENQPHITPIFFVFDEQTFNFYIITSTESKKMKNIHVNPKICLTIDVRDATNPFNNRGVMVQGSAVAHFAVDSLSALENKTLTNAYANFETKYPILQKVEFPLGAKFSDSLVCISPSRLVYWKGPKFIAISFCKQQ